jgi:serine/threonine protein kinase/tetratricopeptide (TPR) repeat protein
MIGKLVSHYEIIEKLGEGGMGVVYRARDTKLKRTVALKFLPPELTQDPEAKARFIQEAQAAAALNHPHICTIYEIDEHDGQSFIAMEFIEGEGLQDKIRRGPLPIDDLLSLTIQIGEGLHEAHQKGIVHRDIKPGNIMLTSRDQVKILDFGLARLGTHSKLTRIDTTLGTVAYMSPEQTSGKEIDRRTDIWSLGVVLYEMITGVRPFTGEYEQAVVYSILHDQPEPVTSRRSQVPMDLERIVGKTLAKNPAERYPHVEDLLVDLRAVRSATKIPGIPQKATPRNKKKMIIITAIVVLIIFSFWSAIIPRFINALKQFTTQQTSESRKMLVVLPFENLGSPEDEYFANGTTDAITARLASLSGLGVISRQSSMQYKKTTKTVRQIGEELGVDYILEGTVQRERPGDPASRVRVIPQLIRVADDIHIWADTYDENMTEVFRVQSDIAERVVTQLDISLLEPERRAIEKRPTENLAAYENYLRGKDYMYSLDVSEVEMSVSLLQKAVSLDPKFAEAWACLAIAHRDLYWAFDRPGELILLVEAANQAQQLAPDLPETHLALGYVAYSQREFDKALKYFERADRLQPSGETAQAIGFTMRRLGRWQEALNYGEKARRILPRTGEIYADILGATKQYLRQFDEAEQDADHTIWLLPQLADGHIRKAQILVEKGDMRAAKEAMLEMSRHIKIAEAAEYVLPQGLTVWTASTYLRLFPESFTKAFEAFEAGPIERYHGIQPAMIATSHLARALIYEALGEQQSAGARYDSARVHFERIIRSNPQSAYVPVYRSDLGLAYAGLGRCEEAVRIGEEAVRMIPISRDAVVGPALIGNLAEIYLRCGKYDKAIDQLEIWLSVPSDVSVELLRVDPIWDPLRSNSRFQRLLKGK